MFTAFRKRSFPYNYELNKYCMDSTLKSIQKMTKEYETERKQNKFILVKKTIHESIKEQDNIQIISAYIGFLSATYFLVNYLFIRK
jgi:hypothetical protein